MINQALDLIRYLFGRPSLVVRVSRDQAEVVGGLKFEIENVGGRTTSLRPFVRVTFVAPKGARFEKHTVIYDVRELDRSLPPFAAKVFEATAREAHANYAFSWFRVYRFQTTTGHWVRVRLRNAQLEPVGLLPFTFERIWFRLTGRVNGGASSVTLAQLDAEERSRGPY